MIECPPMSTSPGHRMEASMKRILVSFGLLFLINATGKAIDLEGLEAIGPVTAIAQTGNAVLLNCADRSQVLVSVLAPDLVRVRASFKKPLPGHDHSWAIARTSWEAARW